MTKWKSNTLSSIASITMGSSPKSAAYNDDGIGLPLIQGNADIKNRLTKPRSFTSEITKECKSGDIIMTVRAPVGAIAKSTLKGCLGRGVCAISATKISQEYLYQYLISQESSWKKIEQGSTFSAVGSKDIKQLFVTYPEKIEEQQKIAEVLSTIDKKIDLIDQKIAETEKLKTGLMQKLFSEGVGVQDSDGNWQPHDEFQDSPFGKIPAMWNLNKLSTYCSIIAGVSPSKLNLNESEGYPFFKVEEFNYSKKLLTKSRNYVSNQASCHTGEFLLLPKRGAAIFLNKLRLAKGTFQIDTNVMGISFDEEVANLDFMLYRLLFERLESIADISTIPQINNKHINPYTIPLPPLGEQQQIAQIISSVFEKIDLLEQQKTETQQLKKGLMQKLLTGEWRVPLDNPEAA
ncbi:restriction endonuclease subunit S [Vibrio vulnificus]|uniref:restriction endonuclease subunit S n=1 Tax=Vibrio vulnificus TaxID=672 RepID=UPI0019D4B588|nr:restriction endonuclease subunit S [Vibrio vulnificus]MBN8135808.1 restriction endonuclease subunit S [Vibrio vulnificus]